MTNYEGSMTGADNVRKGGATNGGGPTNGTDNPGGPGTTKVVGTPSPIVAKGGATNNGR